VPISGTWSAETAGDNRINLTLNFILSVNGEARPMNSTVLLDMVDNNTLRSVADGTLTKRVGE